jgi:hypothetical protein
MNAPTSFLERASVRKIITGVADEHVHITEGILQDIDALPIHISAETKLIGPVLDQRIREVIAASNDAREAGDMASVYRLNTAFHWLDKVRSDLAAADRS